MNDFEIWRRFAFSLPEQPPVYTQRQLHVPIIERVGDLPYELAGLLPNREHSRDLMALIDNLPENSFGDQASIGVFAADPFLNCKRVADHLLAKGYNQVTNIPPVAGYGSEFLATLDKVASGQAQEQHNIGQMADRGLSVSPALACIDGLPAALTWSPRRLWIVPSFDMWQNAGIRTDLLLDLCHDVTHRTDAPVVLVTGQTGVSASEAANAGASGMLIDAR